MAMLPFCGYHMGDYFAHWIAMGKQLQGSRPDFRLNWFRKGPDGKFPLAGFGEQYAGAEVDSLIAARLAGAVDTPIGNIPAAKDFDLDGDGRL